MASTVVGLESFEKRHFGVSQIGRQEREEKRYYISSLSCPAEEICQLVLIRWSIENELHWHLDVTFSEDDFLIGAEANENLRVARRISLELLHPETSFKRGLEVKMQRCHRSDSYLDQVFMKGNF